MAGLSLLDGWQPVGRPHRLSSTAAVYGDPEKQPIQETDATTPTNPYGAAKLAFEQALGWYGAAYGLASISCRGTSTRPGRRRPEASGTSPKRT